jgi:hypothetical protein
MVLFLIDNFSCIISIYAQRYFRLNTKRNYAIIFLIDNFHVLPLILPNGVLDLIQRLLHVLNPDQRRFKICNNIFEFILMFSPLMNIFSGGLSMMISINDIPILKGDN